MRHLQSIAVAAETASPAAVEDDIYGIVRYLCGAVLDGEITLDDGAQALAEWADTRTLTEIAARMVPGSDVERLVHAASERYAA